MAGEVREELVLVGEIPSSVVERALVQWSEDDAVEAARQREPDDVSERLRGDAP